MAAPSDAARALIDSVKAELREAAGAAWVEPARVHLDVRAKMRGDDVFAGYTVTMWFEGAVVTTSADFSGTRRLRSVRR